MSALTISVTFNGEEHVLPVKPRVVVAFERQWKLGLTKAFGAEQKMEHLYWLGWEAMRAAGHVVKPFDTWLEDVDAVALVPKGDAESET